MVATRNASTDESTAWNAPVTKDHANPRDRVPRQCALLGRLKEAFLDRRYVIARYVPAHYDALERRVPSRFAVSLHRLDVSDHTRVLPRATCLILVRIRELCSLRNRFAECDLRPVVQATPYSRFIRST
jgi:hypothetical protein